MKILVIAAHPDDEVLGAGGTIAKHSAAGHEVHVLIVTEGCSSQYPGQNHLIQKKQEEAKAAASILGAAQVHFGGLPDMKLDSIPGIAVNGVIEPVVRRLRPEIVLTQAEHDVNLDHTIVFRATLVACRPYSAPFVRKLFTYYTPSSSEWGSEVFKPNWFNDIGETIDQKVRAMAAYGTEVREKPHPRHPEVLRTSAAHFGSMAGCNFAEPLRLIRNIGPLC